MLSKIICFFKGHEYSTIVECEMSWYSETKVFMREKEICNRCGRLKSKTKWTKVN